MTKQEETKEQQQIFNLTFNERTLNIVLNALGELPAKNSMGLIQNIQVQIQTQLKKNKDNKSKKE